MSDDKEKIAKQYAIPSESLTTAHEIERAKRLGTYRKLDRSKQYEGRYSPESLLKSDNYQWAKLRKLESTRFRNSIMVTLLAAVLARAPEIYTWIIRLLN